MIKEMDEKDTRFIFRLHFLILTKKTVRGSWSSLDRKSLELPSMSIIKLEEDISEFKPYSSELS